MKTLIVIPCYNEAARLPVDAFVEFARGCADVSFIFVNDGSADNTLDILYDLQNRAGDRFGVLSLPLNRGKAEAVRAGIMHGISSHSPDYIGFWDADLATPLDEMAGFIKMLGRGFDMVTGCRLLRLGAGVKRTSRRHYLGRVFATAAGSLVLRIPVYDTQCGAKLYRADIVPALFGEPFVTRWLFDVEILARYICRYGAQAAAVRIYELPLNAWQDVRGSQVRAGDFIRAPLDLLKIRRHYF